MTDPQPTARRRSLKTLIGLVWHFYPWAMIQLAAMALVGLLLAFHGLIAGQPKEVVPGIVVACVAVAAFFLISWIDTRAARRRYEDSVRDHGEM